MAEQLTQIPKPEATLYKERRKLFLVPIFLFPAEMPDEIQQLLGRYWSEVRDHVNSLERSLGAIVHVYHEALASDGEEGMSQVEALNPKGHSFVSAMCQSTARLEATDDMEALQESTDWQRCITIGLMSEKVRSTAFEGYQEATKRRYEHIGSRIDETLKENEAGVLFIAEGHQVQFASDIQVFYVAPPALDAIKRWMNDRLRPPAAATEDEEAEEAEEQPDDVADDESPS